jgi:chemotaxis protein methyltransferase CheR
MTKEISDAQLSQLSDLIARRFGLHFPREQRQDLARRVWVAAQECGCHDVDFYIQGLLSSGLTQRQVEVLVNHLTVGETYFFREKRSLEIFEERIVPELIRARAGLATPIRIWSAGCSTGEEPYSVAITLRKMMAGRKDCNVEILATDVNTKSLQKALNGTYSDWSFRGTPGWVRHTYFEADEISHCAIVPAAIKKMVHFVQLNLMDDAYPALSDSTTGLDVIFCRNVLMYFTAEAMRKIIRQLHRYLAADGWLIVSPTETSHELFSEFAAVSFGDVTLYRKSATCLPTTRAFSVFDEVRSAVPSPVWTMQGREPSQVSSDKVNQEAPDNGVCSESAAPLISYRQAMSLYEQGRYEDVERVIVALPSENADYASALLLLARAYANQGKLTTALAWCDRAIAANKMAAPLHYLRATILQEQGSLSEAFLALKQAVYAEPEFILGHFALGNLALKHGRRKESDKHFENALLLLARYHPEDVVPETEGLSAGRLREMMVPPDQGTAGIQTRRPHGRIPPRIKNLDVSRR